MFGKTTRRLSAAVLVLLVAAFAVPSFAQVVANDAYQVGYYSANFQAGGNGSLYDQYVRIINTGQIGSPMDPSTQQGKVCADIYVFDANQEMVECCSCPITANGLLSLSLQNSLLNLPLTSVIPSSGVIKIVSDAGCNEQSITTPVNGGLRAFGTHLQLLNMMVPPLATNAVTTETQFQSAPLQNQEAGFLGQACSFVQYLGSGKGHCLCGTDFD
jgi:hypothetical protein